MDELVKQTRQDIRRSGYKTATRIKLELSDLDKEKVERLLGLIECEDIRKFSYTNIYLANFTKKDIYIYNPNVKKKTKRRRVKSKK